MLTRDGRVKLADFGLARGKGPSDLTLEHASIGTPQYLAPEQAIRGANATHRSDLFSLGATLYHMVTGHPPFAGDNLSEIFQNVIRCRFAPPETVVKDLSLDTVYLIHHLMRAHPRERYASATALLVDLEKLEKGEKIAPPHFKGDYQKYLRRRRARWMVFGGVVTAATVAVAVVGASWWSKRSEAESHRRLCLAANRKHENELTKVATLAQLKELHGKLARVPRAGCRDDEVPDLVRRIAKAATELSLVEKGEAQLAGARKPNAAFRPLHAQAKRLQKSAYLPVTRARLEKIEGEIADLSRQALEDQRNRVRAAGTREELLKELRALERGLRARYVDDEGEHPQVKAEADAVAELIDEWDAADLKHERKFIADLNLHDYRSANRTLTLWIDDLRKPLRRRENLLSAASLALFKLPEDQKQRVKDEELAYWQESIEGPANRLLEEGEVDGAEDLVAPFQRFADATRRDVQMLLDRIRGLKKKTREAQEAEFLKLRARVESSLARRRWLEPAELVKPEAEKNWIPDWRRQVDALQARAAAFRRLYEIFKINARKHGIEPREGEGPYSFVRRQPKEEQIELTRLPHDDLVGILELEKAAPGSKVQGCFYAAESFHNPDPRRREAFARKAYVILKDDVWTVALRDRAEELHRLVVSRERDANTFHTAMDAARSRKDYLAALSQCQRLLNEYRYTDFVEHRRKELELHRNDLFRRVGALQLRLRAGLHERDVLEDVERGTIRFTFDFQEWYPDEDADVPAHEKDKRAWKESSRERLWRGVYRELELDWNEARYRRSIRGLSWFSETLVADPKRGGAVLVGGPHDNHDLWWTGREDEARIVTLHNPFGSPNDWSIECEVMWDAKPTEDEPDRPRPEYPSYFALTAGDIQVGIVYWVDDSKGWNEDTGKPNWEKGGGRGARIFRQTSPLAGLDKLLGEFLEVRIPPESKWRKRKKKDDRTYLGRWNKAVPHRLRLECSGGLVRFYLLPLDGREEDPARAIRLKKYLLLEHRFSRRELAAAWEEKDFRIVSLARCHLREVVIEGLK